MQEKEIETRSIVSRGSGKGEEELLIILTVGPGGRILRDFLVSQSLQGQQAPPPLQGLQLPQDHEVATHVFREGEGYDRP